MPMEAMIIQIQSLWSNNYRQILERMDWAIQEMYLKGKIELVWKSTISKT